MACKSIYSCYIDMPDNWFESADLNYCGNSEIAASVKVVIAKTGSFRDAMSAVNISGNELSFEVSRSNAEYELIGIDLAIGVGEDVYHEKLTSDIPLPGDIKKIIIENNERKYGEAKYVYAAPIIYQKGIKTSCMRL
ncbi:MAG: hypothetical protein ABIH79_01555 [archaeon]